MIHRADGPTSGPMPFALRLMIARDAQADADAAARAVIQYTAAAAAHRARLWRIPAGPARRRHINAAQLADRALGDELAALATQEPNR